MKDLAVHKKVFLTGWLLAVTALIGTGLLAIVNWHSQPYIKLNERETVLRTLNLILPENIYNNDILNDTVKLTDIQHLGSDKPTIIYRARNDGTPIAAVLTVISPSGYAGDIDLLVGIEYSGKLTGVRVVKHRETPGLGDGIEIQRSNWIESFRGKSLIDPGHRQWKVKRDGGFFDQFTGATITPRAVVTAVHKSLIFFQNNRNKIFSPYKVVNEEN